MGASDDVQIRIHMDTARSDQRLSALAKNIDRLRAQLESLNAPGKSAKEILVDLFTNNQIEKFGREINRTLDAVERLTRGVGNFGDVMKALPGPVGEAFTALDHLVSTVDNLTGAFGGNSAAAADTAIAYLDLTEKMGSLELQFMQLNNQARLSILMFNVAKGEAKDVVKDITASIGGIVDAQFKVIGIRNQEALDYEAFLRDEQDRQRRREESTRKHLEQIEAMRQTDANRIERLMNKQLKAAEEEIESLTQERLDGIVGPWRELANVIESEVMPAVDAFQKGFDKPTKLTTAMKMQQQALAQLEQSWHSLASASGEALGLMLSGQADQAASADEILDQFLEGMAVKLSINAFEAFGAAAFHAFTSPAQAAQEAIAGGIFLAGAAAAGAGAAAIDTGPAPTGGGGGGGGNTTGTDSLAGSQTGGQQTIEQHFHIGYGAGDERRIAREVERIQRQGAQDGSTRTRPPPTRRS